MKIKARVNQLAIIKLQKLIRAKNFLKVTLILKVITTEKEAKKIKILPNKI